MQELKISEKAKGTIQIFIQKLKEIYREDLVSAALYGSAASGEFIDKRSNINLLVILKSADLETLAKASPLIKRLKFISPLFLTEDYVRDSLDTFPIEFLDIQENYSVLYGKDILKGLNIDTRNLRFQCEQELKAKLIILKQSYLRMQGDKLALRDLLFKTFTSIMHILRNLIRLKGKSAPYLKPDIIKDAALEFNIDRGLFEKILAVKSKNVNLGGKDTEELFIAFTKELEKIVGIVDKL